MKCLVYDVGGTFIKYAMIDQQENILEHGRVPTPMEGIEVFLDTIYEIYQKFSEEVAGIAMSMPGILDAERGYMYTGGSLSYIRDVNMQDLIREKCKNLPVSIENDAKSAALAEVTSGSLADCNDAMVVICGTGIGGGVIHEKRILRGSHFFAGEFSFINRGCQGENTDSAMWGKAGGVRRLYRIYADITGEALDRIDGEMLFGRANYGDRAAIEAIHRYCRVLAVQLLNLQCMIDPEKIAIGGGISVQPLFIRILREEVMDMHRTYPPGMPLPEIVSCRYFNDANMLGAYYAFRRKYGWE